MDKYKLVDEEKTIHTGTEAEMHRAFFINAWDEKSLHKLFQESRLQDLKDKYRVKGIVGKINVVPE